MTTSTKNRLMRICAYGLVGIEFIAFEWLFGAVGLIAMTAAFAAYNWRFIIGGP